MLISYFRLFLFIFFLIFLSGCKNEKGDHENLNNEKNKITEKYLYKTLGWRKYYDDNEELISEFVTEADFKIYLLPRKICIIDVHERYGMLSKYRFESGIWKVTDLNTISIETTHEKLKFEINNNHKITHVNGSEKRINREIIDTTEILFVDQKIWNEVNGSWIARYDNYEGAFQELILEKDSPLLTLKFKDYTEVGQILYYFYDSDLVYLNSGKVYKFSFGIDEGQNKITDILFSCNRKSKETISLNLKRATNDD